MLGKTLKPLQWALPPKESEGRWKGSSLGLLLWLVYCPTRALNAVS